MLQDNTGHYSIVVARKPLSEKSVVENVLKWGTGGLNIDGSRIGFTDGGWGKRHNQEYPEWKGGRSFTHGEQHLEQNDLGRFPANIIFDEEAGKLLDEQSGISKGTNAVRKNKKPQTIYGNGKGIPPQESNGYGDKGGASRFFYCVKDEDQEYEIKDNNMNIDLRLGDCIEVLKTIPDNSVDSIVTDPPYGIGFMNKEWDSPQKHQELIEREKKRSEERFAEGKSPAKAGFSTGVQPGLPIGGAKEGKWFQDWCELWARECYRVLKPGGHALSFAAPRTYHRMATAFEDVGFQIRDQIMWVFGSGFPKSLNIGKAVDKKEGNEREVISTETTSYKVSNTKANNVINEGTFAENFSKQVDENGYRINQITKGSSEWEGWGTALKPAHEPIVMARKPLSEKSIAENVLKHGTGGINIDGSRIDFNGEKDPTSKRYETDTNGFTTWGGSIGNSVNDYEEKSGRFPANIIFDEEAGQLLDEQSGIGKSNRGVRIIEGKENRINPSGWKETKRTSGKVAGFDDKGGASRFFYCPKTSKKDRNEGLDGFELKEPQALQFAKDGSFKENKTSKSGIQQRIPRANNHPTVKPTDLMRYLINLVTPKGGTTLDPFMGSGSTGKAAVRCGVNFIGIEKEQEYMDIAKTRIEHEKNKQVQTKLL